MIVRRVGRSSSTRSGGTASPLGTDYAMPLMPGCCPGGTAGTEGALTPGVNRLPPVGLTLFSVGAGVLGGDDAGVVVVVVVGVVDGAWFPLVAHPAVINPHDDEGCPGGQTNQARTDAIRTHDVCPVRVA